MISNPEIHAAPTVPSLNAATSARWPRLFTQWQLLSLVPGVVHRLAVSGRVLELEVGAPSLLASLARTYQSSQFIGLTTHELSRKGMAVFESSVSRNLHFRTVEMLDLARFRQVDLVLALGGLQDRTTIREAAQTMAPGGYLVLREEERASVSTGDDTVLAHRFRPTIDRWHRHGSLRQTLTVRAISASFASVHVVRLPEDPGYFYYVARSE